MTSGGYFDDLWIEIGSKNAYFLIPVVLVACALSIRWLSRPKLNLPKGPVGLPFVGYLPFLGKEPYKTLDLLKTKYGNVFSVSMGRIDVIILADYPAVEEAFSKSITANRPPGVFDFLPDGLGFSGANGAQWVEQRRFVLRTMRNLGLGKTTWTTLVEEELSDFLKEISNKNGRPFNIDHLLSTSIANNICSLLFGKRYPPGPVIDSLNAASEATAEFFTQSGLWNYFPWLCIILTKLKISRYYKIFSQMVTLNKFVKKEIEDHRKSQNDDKESDFITEYLEVLKTIKGKEKESFFTEKTMIGDAQALFTGGSDTPKTSLTWLFLIMAAHPNVQEKVYAELESVVGKEQMALWEDRAKFPYTYAVILEAQRWKTLLPLNTSRMAAENMQICGYDIPKGSNIIANNWGLHNDPRYWTEPEKFIPERFLRNGGTEINSRQDSYVPFSYGKRKCPGESVAMMEMFLYFTAIMQNFHIRVPNGGKPNLDGIMGLLYVPVPQELCFIPRH